MKLRDFRHKMRLRFKNDRFGLMPRYWQRKMLSHEVSESLETVLNANDCSGEFEVEVIVRWAK